MADNLPPIEYPDPVDLVALARSYEPDGERGPFSISSCPKHLTWSVESLSDRAGISLVRAYAGLLERGMHEIWRCPGARDLQRDREVIVARGDQDEMRWIDTWEFDVPTADTGKSTPKMRLSVEGILTPLGKLARVLGFDKSQTAVLALTVMLLHDPEVPIRYHQAHVTNMPVQSSMPDTAKSSNDRLNAPSEAALAVIDRKPKVIVSAADLMVFIIFFLCEENFISETYALCHPATIQLT